MSVLAVTLRKALLIRREKLFSADKKLALIFFAGIIFAFVFFMLRVISVFD